ncbi:MAG: hypothetical protein ACOYMG_07605 [Candidatus Methylumidiphilus sp.]
MPEPISFNPDIQQAFNTDKTVQPIVGHLVSLSIGGTAITADLSLTVPTDYTITKVVGAISSITWSGGAGISDPIYISFDVSTANKSALLGMTKGTLAKTDVVFAYHVWCFDTIAKVYFLCFHTTDAGTLKGFVLKQGIDLALSVSETKDGTISSPDVFSAYIGIMPDPSAQKINYAVSNTQKYVKPWGVAVG